jgi:type II secretory pathway pseudopilin PulG
MTRQRGAALMIMLMIAGVLGAMFAIQLAGRAASDRAQVAATTLALSEAREALIGFALVNGRLPCPATATEVTGTALAGLEPAPVVAGGCASAAGVLPLATLGVRETDAWGRRFTYRVTPAFTGAVTPPANAAFTSSTVGDLTLWDTRLDQVPPPSPPAATLAANVPAMIISHGKNGNGAYGPQGVQTPLGPDADERDNQLTVAGTATANLNFVSKSSTPTFDDVATWLDLAVLRVRMTSATRLP